jgi:hypothetical protein
MTIPWGDTRPMQDPEASLEQEFISEFLHSLGLSEMTVRDLPEADRHRVLQQASSYATGRLAEISARAHYVEDLRHRD